MAGARGWGRGGRVFVIPLAGGKSTEVTSGPQASEFGALGWSADGRSLLTRNRRTGEVMAVPVDGRPAVELAVPGDATELVAHPDGKRMGYVAGESAYELWILERFLPAS